MAATLLMAGCGSGKSGEGQYASEPSEKRAAMEAEGQKCLARAREALRNREFEKAHKEIQTLRENYTLALNAREEGILLSDSISLHQAKAQLQEVDAQLLAGKGDTASLQASYEELCRKVKFYHRKLQYDKGQKKVH